MSNTADPARGGGAHVQDALGAAAARGDAARAEDLLRSGANVNGTNRFGRTPIQVMMMGSSRVARLLLSRGADPNVRDRSTGARPLHDAARAGFVDTVRALLEFGADPESRDARGSTPAELARVHGHEDTAQYINNFTAYQQQQQQQQQQQ